jgi:hypothetical protein
MNGQAGAGPATFICEAGRTSEVLSAVLEEVKETALVAFDRWRRRL